jgi:hypothetical protein
VGLGAGKFVGIVRCLTPHLSQFSNESVPIRTVSLAGFGNGVPSGLFPFLRFECLTSAARCGRTRIAPTVRQAVRRLSSPGRPVCVREGCFEGLAVCSQRSCALDDIRRAHAEDSFPNRPKKPDSGHRLTVSSVGVNFLRSSACCVSSIMTSDVEFWRQEPAAKAEDIAQEIERLARRALAADLSVTAYILQLAVEEARKERAAKHPPPIAEDYADIGRRFMSTRP